MIEGLLQMIVLKRASKEEMNRYRIAFIKAMDYAYQIFGEKVFRMLVKITTMGR